MFIKVIKDDRAATGAEYALILAGVGSLIAIAAVGLGAAVGKSVDGVTLSPPPASQGAGSPGSSAHGANPNANPKAGAENPGKANGR